MSTLSRIILMKSICKFGSNDLLRSSTSSQLIGLKNLSDDSSSDSEHATPLQNVDTFKCLNRVTLMGRATGPAVITKLPNTDLASFTLVTNELRRNRANELIKRSEFHKIQVFSPRLAQKTVKVLQKGSRLLVEGKINYNVRKGEHGNIHFTNIIAENIVFITGNRVSSNLEEESDSEIVEEHQEQHQSSK